MSNIGINKYKSMMLLIVLILSTILISCQNITSEDINFDDLNNILGVIMKDDESDTVSSPLSTDLNTTEVTDFADVADTNIVIDIFNPTETKIETSTETKYLETTFSEISKEVDASLTEKVLSSALKDFPDMPDIFKYVPFPDTLIMSDSLKQAMKNLDGLLKKDYNNSDFYIATTIPELITPILGGGALSDAKHYRTRLVETAYNTKLKSIRLNEDDIYQTVSNSIKSGEYISDIVCTPLDVQSLFIQDGLLINLRKMPFMNLNADYYNQSSVYANTMNGEVYGVVSDLIFDPGKMYAVFYNKNLLKKCGIDNLNELYENDKWSYDDMLAICKKMTINIDTAANDLFTIGMNSKNSDIINGMHIPADYSHLVNDNIKIEPTTITEQIDDIISRIIYNRDGISPLISTDDESQKNVFSQGSMLFAIMPLNIIPEITNTPFDWSVLPIPSVNINESYLYPSLSFTDSSALCISILKNAVNTEKCGIITEALSLASYNYMREIYVNDLMTYNLRDVTSVNVIAKLLDNVMYKNHIKTY